MELNDFIWEIWDKNNKSMYQRKKLWHVDNTV